MNRSEIISKYSHKITDSAPVLYRSVLESYGMIQYQLYVWEDGEIDYLEQVQGDNAYLIPKDSEPRTLAYVCTISSPCFDPWDYTDHSAPETEEEREKEQEEIIDCLVDSYRENLSDMIDCIIREAEQEEAETF